MLRAGIAWAVLLSGAPLCADFCIKSEHRVVNTSHNCMWASLESLGNHLGIKEVKGLEAKNLGAANCDQAFHVLSQLGIECTLITKDAKFVEASDGCVVGVMNWPNYGDRHGVIVTHLNAKICCFIDCNTHIKYWALRVWFDQHWCGWALRLKK